MIGSTRHTSHVETARQAQLAKDIGRLQQQVSTGKRLIAGSDDPAAADRIAAIRQTRADHATWIANSDTGAAIANAADTTLGSVANALTRAKELVLAGRNDTLTNADRTTLANELRGIIADIASYAQATDPSGRALFPTGPVNAIPVSESLNYSATAARASVFDSVSTGAGTQTLTAILSAAAAALDTGNGAGLTTGIAQIDSGVAHIGTVRTDQGIRAQRFADAKERLENSDADLAIEKSALADTDLTYALSEVQSKQVALQAAQTIFAQTHRSGLFDLLS